METIIRTDPQNFHGLDSFNITVPNIKDLQRFKSAEVAFVEQTEEETTTVDESRAGENPDARYFWSVYLRLDPEHPTNDGFRDAECIGDFPTKDMAIVFAAWLEMALGWSADSTLEWLPMPGRYTNKGVSTDNLDAAGLIAQVNSDEEINQGHNDWRLPTIHELKTLTGKKSAPQTGVFWSSTNGTNSHLAFYMDFQFNSIGTDSRSTYGRVKLVRRKD